MPKILAKYSVTTRNEYLSLQERITPSKAVRTYVSTIGVPRPLYKPKQRKVVPHTLTKEESNRLSKEFQEEAAEKSLISRLTLEKRRLDQRLSDPPLPLIDRITEVDINYQIPPEVPKTLHFRKKPILVRLKEVYPILEATKIRLDPLFDKLNADDIREDQGFPARVPSEVRDNLWTWYDGMQEWYKQWDVKGHKLTHHQYRYLIGPLKKIGKVKFTSLEERFVDICTELAGLNISFPPI